MLAKGILAKENWESIQLVMISCVSLLRMLFFLSIPLFACCSGGQIKILHEKTCKFLNL